MSGGIWGDVRDTVGDNCGGDMSSYIEVGGANTRGSVEKETVTRSLQMLGKHRSLSPAHTLPLPPSLSQHLQYTLSTQTQLESQRFLYHFTALSRIKLCVKKGHSVQVHDEQQDEQVSLGGKLKLMIRARAGRSRQSLSLLAETPEAVASPASTASLAASAAGGRGRRRAGTETATRTGRAAETMVA